MTFIENGRCPFEVNDCFCILFFRVVGLHQGLPDSRPDEGGNYFRESPIRVRSDEWQIRFRASALARTIIASLARMLTLPYSRTMIGKA